MQLNIYILSHPIITLLAESIKSSNVKNITQIHYYKYCGLLIIYEISRKWLYINKIYVKKFQYIKKLHILDKSHKYYIFTDIKETYMMLDIQLIIPNIEIIDIKNYNELVLKQNIEYNLNNYNKDKINIIIFEKVLSELNIIKLIKYLNIDKNIPLKYINIACIACYNDILNLIGKQYSQLKIYTTKIIK